ncbi:MAG: hypothetical protein J6X67_11525, partial [Treponema sp.]|nr:hypothetical protein [Treponema sp.]
QGPAGVVLLAHAEIKRKQVHFLRSMPPHRFYDLLHVCKNDGNMTFFRKPPSNKLADAPLPGKKDNKHNRPSLDKLFIEIIFFLKNNQYIFMNFMTKFIYF